MTLAKVRQAGRRRENAAKRHREASRALEAAIIEAVEAGEPVTHVADAAGITRQLVHRLLRRHREGR